MASPDTAAREAITIVSVLALLFIASIFTFVIGGRRKNNQLDVPDKGSSQTGDGSPDDRRKSRDAKNNRSEEEDRSSRGKKPKKERRDDKSRKKDEERWGDRDEGGTRGDGGRRVGGEEGSGDGGDHGVRRHGGSSTTPDSSDLSSAYTVGGGGNDNLPPGPPGTRAGTMKDVFRIADDLKLTVQSNPDDRYRIRTIYNVDSDDWAPGGGSWPRQGDGPGGGAEAIRIPFTSMGPATPLTPGFVPAFDLPPTTPGPFWQTERTPNTPVMTPVSAYPPVTATLQHVYPVLVSDVSEDGLDPWAYTSAAPAKTTFTAEELGWYKQRKEATKPETLSDELRAPGLDETLGPGLDPGNKYASTMFGHLGRTRTANVGDITVGSPRMETSGAWGEAPLMSPINLNPIYVRDPKDRSDDQIPILLSPLKAPNKVNQIRKGGVDLEEKMKADDRKHSKVTIPPLPIKIPMTSKVRFEEVSSRPTTSFDIEEVDEARWMKKNDSDSKVKIRNVKKKETANEQEQEEEKNEVKAAFEDEDIVEDEKPKGKPKKKEKIEKTAEKKENSTEKVKKSEEVEILVGDPKTGKTVKKKIEKEIEESEDEKVEAKNSSKKNKEKNNNRTEGEVPKRTNRKEKKKENRKQLSGDETEEKEEEEGEEEEDGENDKNGKKQNKKLVKKKKTKKENKRAAEEEAKNRERKRSMERGDEVVEDQAQDESSEEAVYEKYTDSNGKKRLRRVPIDTTRIKRKPKKNKQRMADAGQYNEYIDDEEEMDEVQEAARVKKTKASKQQQPRQETRQGRIFHDEQYFQDTAPINLATSDQINQMQPFRRQRSYNKELLQTRLEDIEDEYDNPNLTTNERRDIASRRLRMLSNHKAAEKEADELQRLMAEGGRGDVGDPPDEVTRERKSLREKIKEKFDKTEEAKREDAQTDESNIRLRTEKEEIALEDNVRVTAEVRQPTKPQKTSTLHDQDTHAPVLELASTNADDRKPDASPLAASTEKLREDESQEKPKERKIDPRLDLLASRRPGQVADPRQPIQAPRALAPSARSMEELEANRLHLRERRHPKKEETREETEAEEKDQVDETNEGEGLHTLRSETGSHVTSHPDPENPAEVAGLATRREVGPPVSTPEQESDESQSVAHSQRISDNTAQEPEIEIEKIQPPIVGVQLQRWMTQDEETETELTTAEAAKRAALERRAHWERERETAGESTNLTQLPSESEAVESHSRELLDLNNVRLPSAEDRQVEEAVMNDDHQSQIITARKSIELQPPSANSDHQIVTRSHAVARRQTPLTVAPNALQNISDHRLLADHYESTGQEIETHQQTDYLPAAIRAEHEFDGADEEMLTKSGMVIEGKKRPMAIVNSASFNETENGQAIGSDLVQPNSRAGERQVQVLDSDSITERGTGTVGPQSIASLKARQQEPLVGNKQVQMDSQPSSDIARQIPDVDRHRPVFDLTDLSEEQIAEYELTGSLPPALRADYDLEEHSDGGPATTSVQLGIRSGRRRQAAFGSTSHGEKEEMTESQIVPSNRAPSQPAPERPVIDSMSLHDRQTIEERSSQLVPSSTGALLGRVRERERPALSSVPHESSDSEEEAEVDGNALVRSKDLLRERERPQLDSVPFEERERIEETGTDFERAKAARRRLESVSGPRTLDFMSYEDRQGPASDNPSFLGETDTYDEIDVEHLTNERRQRLLAETAHYLDESGHEESGERIMEETTKMDMKPFNFSQDDVESERMADTDIVRATMPRSPKKLADPISPDQDNVVVPRQRAVPTRIVTNKPIDNDGESIPPLSGSTAINSSDEEEFADQTHAQMINIKNMEADQTVAIKNALADNPALAHEYQEARLRQRNEDDIQINHRKEYARRQKNKGADDSDRDAEDLGRIPFGYEPDNTNDIVSIHITSDEDTHEPASQQPSRQPPLQLSPRQQPSPEQGTDSPDPLRSPVEITSSENENEVSTESTDRTPAEVARDHWKNQSDRERQQRANEDQAQKPSTHEAGSDQQSDDEPAAADSQSQEKKADSTEGQRPPLAPPSRTGDELSSPKTQPDRQHETDQKRKKHRRFGHEDRRGRKENLDEEIIPEMSKKELREQRLEDMAKGREADEKRENERDEVKHRDAKSKENGKKRDGDQGSGGGRAKEGKITGDEKKDSINRALYNSRIALGPVTLVKASWHILKIAPVWSFFVVATLALYIEVSRQLFEMLSVAAGTAVLTKRAISNSTPVDLSVTQSWFSDLVKNLSFEPTAFFAFISMWSIICIPMMGLLIHKTLSVAAEPKGTNYWKHMWQDFKEYGRGSLRVLIMGRHFSTPRVFWRRSTRWTYLRILIFSIQLVGAVLIIRQMMSLIYIVGTGSSTSFSSLPDVASSQKSMKEVAESLDAEGAFAIVNFLFFLFLLTIAGSWYALLHPRIRSLSKRSSSETTDKESNSGRQGRYHLPGVRTSLKWLFILVVVVTFTASLLYFRDIASYITKQSGDSANGNMMILGVNCIFMSLMAAMGYVVYELDKIWVGQLKEKFVKTSGKGFRLSGCWRDKDESMA